MTRIQELGEMINPGPARVGDWMDDTSGEDSNCSGEGSEAMGDQSDESEHEKDKAKAKGDVQQEMGKTEDDLDNDNDQGEHGMADVVEDHGGGDQGEDKQPEKGKTNGDVDHQEQSKHAADHGALLLLPKKKANKYAPVPTDYARIIFAIPAIATNILGRLPLTDRLACTAVNTCWNHQLSARPELWSTPTFAAPFLSLAALRNSASTASITHAEWLDALASADGATCTHPFCANTLEKAPHRTLDRAAINPVFLDRALASTKTCLSVRGATATLLVVDPEHVQPLLDLHVSTAATASWRAMLLTNPPVTRFQAYAAIPGDGVSSADGVTLGQVAEYLLFMFEWEARRDGVGVVVDVRAERILDAVIQRSLERGV
ncbi:hypothetical protein BDV95DRAFT_606566 [Massariosphaeria phaeospora]|uniref:F-box domain-containing protein n=1 Tax=Massariosphaeria phaeospora TaxID=100035 RepID=A0A7C8MAE5_9PLEO|nr:hypothetical protein BDV95DRAFT_606566 [Massariosphaeria phaeospora]